MVAFKQFQVLTWAVAMAIKAIRRMQDFIDINY